MSYQTQGQAPLRVIQVGIGGFGTSWAEIAQRSNGIVLTAVVDPAPAARQWAAEHLGLTTNQIFESLDDALNTVTFEAVLVITPPATHHAVATQALLAGMHVLVEKPLATTIAEAKNLIATAEHQQRTLMVSQNYRFRKPPRTIQRFIADGGLGDHVSVHVICRRDTRNLWPADNFRYHMRHPYVLDMAIHHFDLIRALTVKNIARIDARSWRVPDSPYVHDPAMAAVIDLDNGVPVIYEGNWATCEQETSWNGDWTFVGERGRLLWTGGTNDPLTGRVQLSPRNGPPYEIHQVDVPSSDRRGSLQAFRNSILTGEPAETSADDNIYSLAAVIGCVDSVEQGVPVALADFL